MPTIRRALSRSDIEIIARLAEEIWNEHYISIIGREQVDYMVENFQSATAMQDQLDEGYRYYIVEYDSRYAGYFAVLEDREANTLFLSKLYVHRDFRGKGIARVCISYIEDICRALGLTKVWLTVNKYNDLAIRAYEKMGFVVVDSMTQDIGNGFIMDDYKMEKKI